MNENRDFTLVKIGNTSCWKVVFKPTTSKEKCIGEIFKRDGSFFTNINGEDFGPFDSGYEAGEAVYDEYIKSS